MTAAGVGTPFNWHEYAERPADHPGPELWPSDAASGVAHDPADAGGLLTGRWRRVRRSTHSAERAMTCSAQVPND